MRLIDADEMLENLTEAYIKAQPNCDELTAKVNMVVHDKITRLIKYTPTAHDIDKVVEQLEKEKGIAFVTLANTGNKELDFTYQNVVAYMDKAIEIVKEGGVE